MWPWGHAGIAYLCYTLYTRWRYGRAPNASPVLALVVGSQFPDLLDKPLAWTFDILPGGRTLGHTLLFATLLLPAVYALAHRLDRVELAIAFAIGHLSHLVADVPPSVLRGDLSGTVYLLWPLFGQPPEQPVEGILHALFTYYELGVYEWLQLGLFVVTVVRWYRDGMPGIDLFRRPVGRRGTTRG